MTALPDAVPAVFADLAGQGSAVEQLRRAAARVDALSDEQRAAAAEALAKRRVPFEITQGMIISGYAPIRSELDPAPLINSVIHKALRWEKPA